MVAKPEVAKFSSYFSAAGDGLTLATEPILAFSRGKGLAACQDFHIWRAVRNDIDKVIETYEFVMQNLLNVATCIAHHVIEEVRLCVAAQSLAV